MAHRHNETVLCLDSFNRDERAYPDSNDCTIELKHRYDMQALTLGSFEFPHNQYLIEEEWATFCFDVGLTFDEMSSRSIVFTYPFNWRVTMIPKAFTCMKQDDDHKQIYRTTHIDQTQLNILSDTYQIQESTVYESHGLCPDSPSIFKEGLQLRLLDEDDNTIEHTHISVISAYEIEIVDVELERLTPYATLQVTAANTRTFKNPSQIAEHLTAYCRYPPSQMPVLNQDFENYLLFNYDVNDVLKQVLKRMRFQYDNTSLSMLLHVTAPISDFPNELDVRDRIVISTKEGSLLQNFNIELPQESIESKYLPEHSVGIFPTCNFEYQAEPDSSTSSKNSPTSISIPPGNYDPASLKSTLDSYINSSLHHVIPKAVADQNEIQAIVSGLSTILYVSVSAIFSHHPAALAQALEKSLRNAENVLNITDDGFKCVYKNHRFRIFRTDNKRFRIIWPDQNENNQNIKLRLGFYDSLSMQKEHISDIRVFYNLPSSVSMFNVYRQQHYTAIKRYTFEVEPKHDDEVKIEKSSEEYILTHSRDPSPEEKKVITLNYTTSEKKLTISIDNPGVFPSESIVKVKIKNSIFHAVVEVAAEIDDEPLESLLHILGNLSDDFLTTFQLTDVTSIHYLPSASSSLNFYFPPAITRGVEIPQPGLVATDFQIRKSWSRMAEILGFYGGCHSSEEQAGRQILKSSAQWCFDPPSYVLLDLGLQHASVTTHHRSGDSMFKHMFGKLVMYPTFLEKRHIPIQAISTGNTVISSLHVRIYNPWHQLYNLHKRNWSLTLILTNSQRAAVTECR